jgi:NTP pyrophosphatase (non-canonical NTP hydrolase)
MGERMEKPIIKQYTELCLVTESPIDDKLEARLVAQARAIHGFMGLQTETGEFVDKFKRHIFYGAPLDNTNSAEEIGDIMWYMSILLSHLGIEWEECMLANIAKLKKRYGEKYSHHAALNRDLEGERQVLEGSLLQAPKDRCVVQDTVTTEIKKGEFVRSDICIKPSMQHREVSVEDEPPENVRQGSTNFIPSSKVPKQPE